MMTDISSALASQNRQKIFANGGTRFAKVAARQAIADLSPNDALGLELIESEKSAAR
jgi:hypothetical protein